MFVNLSNFSKTFMAAGLAFVAVSVHAENAPVISKTEKTTVTKTAQDQGASVRDTELTRKIREQIVADQSLSMRAKNVTIISQNGQVTLKGPVATNQEQAKVEEIAKKAKGAQSVVNQTEVLTTR